MNFKTFTFTALALVLSAVAPLHAALTYASGDLLLGIYSRTAGFQYVVNLGTGSIFRDATTPLTLSLGNVGADLVDTFGSNWNEQADLYWGIFGAVQDTALNGDLAYTVYAGAKSTPGSLATAYPSGSAGTLATRSAGIEEVGRAFANVDNHATTNSSVATVLAIDAASSFATKQTSSENVSFGNFNFGIGNFGATETGTSIDLFRLSPGSTSTRTNTYEGTFTISSSGQLTFTPAAVPEPASLVLLGLGLAALPLWARFRRSRVAA